LLLFSKEAAMTATDPEKQPGDHQDDAINKGVSTEAPAEGVDDAPEGRTDGSPQDAEH
jgi:hypothetical protein